MRSNFISINPDTLSLSGHFFFYDWNLEEQCTLYNLEFYSLCWKNTPLEIIESHPKFIPTFSDHSWAIGNQGLGGVKQEVAKKFSLELNDALGKIHNGKEQTLLYMYTGSLEHAEIVTDVVFRQDNIVANINLFWLPFVDIYSDKFRIKWKTFLRMVSQSSKIKLTVTTTEMKESIYKIFGLKFDVAPHPSTLFSDQDFVNLKTKHNQIQFNSHLHDSDQEVVVLFPGRGGKDKQIIDKGYLLSTKITKELLRTAQSYSYRCFMRKVDASSNELKQAINDLNGLVHFFDDTLSQPNFIKLIQSANIIVIPYSETAFSQRTSGLFTDSLYLGKPIVALKGTWMGNRIEEFNCGLVAETSSSSSFSTAINDVAQNYSFYKKNALKASFTWFTSNSWLSLFSSLLETIALTNEL
jgi:glycosyltransferase involved in cell wall biosynthesis